MEPSTAPSNVSSALVDPHSISIVSLFGSTIGNVQFFSELASLSENRIPTLDNTNIPSFFQSLGKADITLKIIVGRVINKTVASLQTRIQVGHFMRQVSHYFKNILGGEWGGETAIYFIRWAARVHTILLMNL
jgi:hypothetical protein